MQKVWKKAGVSAAALSLLTLSLAAWAKNAAEQRIRRDLKYLASKECEGRGTETKGIELAAKYIARQFAEAGLKPGGKNGAWYQPFVIRSSGKLQPGSRVILHGPQGQSIELKEGAHFTVMGNSAGGKVTAPLVFAGYGVSVPDKKYDDYAGIDVKGKVVVVLRRLPRWNNSDAPFVPESAKNSLASLENRVAEAEIRGAGAFVLVNHVVDDRDALTKFSYLARATGASIPAVHLKRSVLDALLRSVRQQSLRFVEKRIDAELKPQSGPLDGWSITIETKVQRKETLVKNVVGVLPSTGELAGEYVVVGAHYDHLGYGERGSLAPRKDRKKIHFGADDNASGTTAMMELARRLAATDEAPRRTLVFIAFSAEEKGLLGSRHYCNREPLYPLEKTIAMVNLDMVGRLSTDPKTKKDVLRVQGSGTAKSFDALLASLNKRFGFDLRKSPSGFGPSDHASFNSKKVPVLFFWTGTHKDYHRPTDTYDRINYPGMLKIIDLAEEVVRHLASTQQRPQYVFVAPPKTVRPAGKIPKMGIIPDYDESIKGLKVADVRAGGPAAKAGMKANDIIVAIGNRPVTNIRTYMVIMSRHKAGQPVPVTVLRGKKKVTLKVVPQ